MDAQHRSDLTRILENRKRRGVRTATPQPSPSPSLSRDQSSFLPLEAQVASPPPSTNKRSIPMQNELPPRAPSTQFGSSPVRDPPTPQQQENQAPPQPQVAAQPSYRFTAAAQRDAAGDEKDRESKVAAQLLRQQSNLQKHQVEQQRQLTQMQSELRQGLSAVSSALRNTGGGSPSSHALTNDRKSSFMVQSGGLTHRLEGLQRGGSFDRANGGSAPRDRAIKFSSLQRQNSMDNLPSQMPKNLPLPVRFDEEQGKMVASPRAVTFPEEQRSYERYCEELSRAPREPLPLPTTAQPFSSTSIDIDSSVTVLRSGDWFLKWNSKGSEVRPRYIWLDTEKNIISWGKERGAASLLSGYVRIEDIVEVTTDQMAETGPDDVPRVFYILQLHIAKGKKMQLATEKREKLNLWFDALNNIALFYRVRGTQTMHTFDPSTE